MEPSHKQPPGCELKLHSIKYQPGILEAQLQYMKAGTEVLLFTDPLSSMFLLFDNYWQASLNIFLFMNLAVLCCQQMVITTTCTNGFSLMDNCSKVCCHLHLLESFSLVCAWVMREESGTCCIPIRVSKIVSIYGNDL